MSCAHRSALLKVAYGNATAATCGPGHQVRSPLNEASSAQELGTFNKMQAEMIQCDSVLPGSE